MPKRTKKLKGGSNRAYRLSTGRSLRKTGSNIPEQSKGKKSKVRRGSPLSINSKDRYELSFLIRGAENMQREYKIGKFTTQRYEISDIVKKITTVASVDENINDIIAELNEATGAPSRIYDNVLWDRVKPFRGNPKVSYVIRNYPQYKFLTTFMRDSDVKGELGLLEIKKL